MDTGDAGGIHATGHPARCNLQQAQPPRGPFPKPACLQGSQREVGAEIPLTVPDAPPGAPHGALPRALPAPRGVDPARRDCGSRMGLGRERAPASGRSARGDTHRFLMGSQWGPPRRRRRQRPSLGGCGDEPARESCGGHGPARAVRGVRCAPAGSRAAAAHASRAPFAGPGGGAPRTRPRHRLPRAPRLHRWVRTGRGLGPPPGPYLGRALQLVFPTRHTPFPPPGPGVTSLG